MPDKKFIKSKCFQHPNLHEVRFLSFTISSLSIPHGLQSPSHCTAAGTQHIFIEVIPCSLKGSSEVGDIAVGLDPNLPLQNGLHGIVHDIEVWRGRGPHLLAPKPLKVCHQAWTLSAECEGALSCWKIWLRPVQGIDPGFIWSFSIAKSTFSFTLTPSGMKIRGVFLPHEVTPAQTMTEAGFCLQKTVLSWTGMLLISLAKTQSLWMACTVKIFSSVQMMLGCVPDFMKLRSSFDLASLFSIIAELRTWRFWRR